MNCTNCNKPGVLNTILGKDFYYCPSCKDEILPKVTAYPVAPSSSTFLDKLSHPTISPVALNPKPISLNDLLYPPGHLPGWSYVISINSDRIREILRDFNRIGGVWDYQNIREPLGESQDDVPVLQTRSDGTVTILTEDGLKPNEIRWFKSNS